MASSKLEELRELAYNDPKNSGWKYLQYLEKNNYNKARDVVSIGSILLENKYYPSKNNRWRLLERVIIACLEISEKKLCKKYIAEVTNKFSLNSNRCKILHGLSKEKKEEWKDALIIYQNTLKNNPNSINAEKRKITLAMEQKQYITAIQMLCNYLTLYSNDFESWKQLSIIYLDIHCYELAKFTVEELLTINHDCFLLNLMYAEILYNIGGNNNLINALKYFSQSLLLSNDKINNRALYGILMTIKSMKEFKDELTSNDKELIKYASNKIMSNYTDCKCDNALLEIVKEVLLTFDSE